MSGNSNALMPKQIAVSLNELLDSCAVIKPEQQVLILAVSDGLNGGYNIVDEATVAWIQAGVQQRGAEPSVLWIDVPSRPHAWRLPRVLKAALAGADVLISNSFDLPYEEIFELRETMIPNRVTMVRNMATTASLLASDWAQTSYDLVSEIRLRTASLFTPGLPWTLTHPNGTLLEGKISPPIPPRKHYVERRSESIYRPFPEGVFTPITPLETKGTLVFERTSPWWSRYIKVPVRFTKPVRVAIENNRITSFDGGEEAKALDGFFRLLAKRLGEIVYELGGLHGGVHPHARVAPHQCPDESYRAFIEHHHSSSVHLHLGATPYPRSDNYPYMLHITGEISGSTLKVGDTLVYDQGRLTTLDHPEIQAMQRAI